MAEHRELAARRPRSSVNRQHHGPRFVRDRLINVAFDFVVGSGSKYDRPVFFVLETLGFVSILSAGEVGDTSG